MVGKNQGDHERATALLEESLGLYRELGDEHGIASLLNALAMVATRQGDLARAVRLFEDALTLSRETGDAAGVARCLGNLSYTVLLLGDHGRARTLAEEALATSREQGNTLFTFVALINLGLAAHEHGDHEGAGAALREGLALGWEIGDKLGVIETLEGIAGLAGVRGEDYRAARLWGAAQAWREATGAQLADADRALNQPHLDAARSRLGDATWEELLAEGRSMTLERAMATRWREATVRDPPAWPRSAASVLTTPDPEVFGTRVRAANPRPLLPLDAKHGPKHRRGNRRGIGQETCSRPSLVLGGGSGRSHMETVLAASSPSTPRGRLSMPPGPSRRAASSRTLLASSWRL